MKIALLRTSATVAIVVGLSLTAAAEEPAGPGQAPVDQPAGAPQDVGATIVTPEGRHQQSASVERQQVPVGDGETVTVLRPVAAEGEEASGQEQGVQRETRVTLQVAAGRRMWLMWPRSATAARYQSTSPNSSRTDC
jgi:hypothetical protein